MKKVQSLKKNRIEFQGMKKFIYSMRMVKLHYVDSILKQIFSFGWVFFNRMEQKLLCIINQNTTFSDALADLTYLWYVYYL